MPELTLKLLTTPNDVNTEQTFTILDLLESYVFAGQDIRLYNATKAYAKGTRVILPSSLSGSTTTHVYEAKVAIPANQAFAVGNWTTASVASQLTDVTGVMSTLTTTQKTTLVAAINELVSTIATNLSTAKTYTDTKITDLIGGSGDALDTLKELATALNNDPNFASTMMSELAKKSNIGHTHQPSDVIQNTTNRFVTDAQITLWTNKASTAVATQSANGLMSSGDKIIVDNGQQFRLTNNNGSGKGLTNSDFNQTVLGGWYNAIATDVNGFGVAGTLMVSTRASSGIFHFFHMTDGSLATRNSNDSGVTWSPWKRQADMSALGNAILGNKFVDTTMITFMGKVPASNAINPHSFYRASGVLAGPTVGLEQNATEISRILSEDGQSSVYAAANTAGTVSAHKFHYNIIEHLERTYGTIPAATLSEKIVWAKKNLSEIAFVWTGNGSSAGGNKATVRFWNGTAWVQFNNNAITTGALPVRVSDKITTPAQMDLAIDNLGFVYVVAYGEPSDGTVISSISTDYMQLNVTLSTDIRTTMLLNNVQGYKITSDEGLAKLTGVTDMNTLTETGVYYTNGTPANAPTYSNFLVEVYRADGESRFIQTATDLATNTRYIRAFSGYYRQWDKLTGYKSLLSALSGNDLSDTIVATFENKVTASLVANPHIAKSIGGTSIATPANAQLTELDQNRINQLSSLDGVTSYNGKGAVGQIAQDVYTFNLLELYERNYGLVPGSTVLDKVDWLRKNVSSLIFNWWGRGTGPSGNRVTIKWWNTTYGGGSWEGTPTSTSGSITKVVNMLSKGTNTVHIDNQGLVHYTAYAEAASSTVPSTIHVDYLELNVTFTTNFLNRLTSAPVRGKIDLANSSGSVNITFNGETGQADVKSLNINGLAAETQVGSQSKATTAETNAKAYTDTNITNLVDQAPNVLNTLKKLAAAINNDANYATTIANQFINHTQPASSIVESTTKRFATDVQIAFWNAKASTAVATQSADGLMSSTSKILLDNGQQWKLTENSGAAFLLTENTDMNTITTGKTYRLYTAINAPLGYERSFWYIVEVNVHDAQFFTQRATVFSPISSNRVGETYTRTFHNGTWTTWRRTITNSEVGKLVLGNAFKDTMTANFVSKVRNSLVEVPHVASASATATSLLAPSLLNVEIGDYSGLNTTAGTAIVSRTLVNQIAHLLFTFDIIAQVERTYNMVIPGANAAEKSAWLRVNLNGLTANWYGFGLGPAGNKAYLTMYYAGASSQWGSFNLTTASATPARLTITRDTNQLVNYIDDAGKVYVLAYSDASNGTISSTLTTTNIELLIDMNLDLKTSLSTQGVQAVKVTEDSGKAFTQPNNTDFSRLISTGIHKFEVGKSQIGSPNDTQPWLVTVAQIDDTTAVQMWRGIATTRLTYRVVSSDGSLKEFLENVDVNALGSSVMGNTVTNVELMNFMNKTPNNLTTNPHVAYSISKSTLALVTDGTELVASAYSSISREDGTTAAVSTNTSGVRAQFRVAFNVQKHVENTIGNIPSDTQAGKIAWLKANVSQLKVAYLGNGSSSTGNKASLSRWDATNGVWVDTGANTTSATPARLTVYPPATTSIDANGYMQLLVYAEPSNGTVASVINMKYVETEVTLTSDLFTTLVSKTIKGRMSIGDNAGTETIALDGVTGRVDVKSVYLNGLIAETQTGAQTKATTALNTAKAYTDTKVADLVASSPAALDTLKELADALGNDPNFATSIATQLGNKANIGHTHDPSVIIQNASNRFVSDAEKTAWNAKETPTGAQTKATTAETNAKAYADTKTAAILDGAPLVLDSLRKIALALNSDPAAFTTLKTYTDTKASTAYSDAKNYAKNINSVNITDTRDIDSLPNEYMVYGTGTTLSGKGVYYEFKKKGTVGLSTAAGAFLLLKTIAKWTDTSGGLPTQTAYDDAATIYTRYATSETTWSTWLIQETTAGSQAKATLAETNAKSYADVKVAAIFGTPPATLNTLQKIATAINNDPAVFTTLTNSIATKANATHQHAPSDIVTSSSARFVTDSQIASWVAKADASVQMIAGTGLTGGGTLAASRTFSINFAGTGSAVTSARSDHTHNTQLSLKTQAHPMVRAVIADGLSTYTSYQDANRPAGMNYGEVLSFGGYSNGASANGQAEMLVSWQGVPKMYIRSLQDISNPWSAWNQVWTAGDFNHADKVDKTTSITAGTGLTGGGDLSTSRSFNVVYAGNGSANSAARSDHTHTYSLNSLTDTNIGSPVAGHTLRHNGTSWVNAFPTMNDNTDITLSGVATNHILQFSGSTWVNRTLAAAGIAASALVLTAGTGLSGGGNLTANRTFSIDFAGTGSAVTSARSDHNHDTTYLKQTGGNVTGDINSTANMSMKIATTERVEIKATSSAKKAYMKYNEVEDSLDFIFE